MTPSHAQSEMVDQEATRFAHELPEAFLQCRDYGHSWKAYTARWDPEFQCYVRVLSCPRCLTKRVQRLSQTGAALGGHYDYPDGYTHNGLGRLDGTARNALRLESVSRAIEGAA